MERTPEEEVAYCTERIAQIKRHIEYLVELNDGPFWVNDKLWPHFVAARKAKHIYRVRRREALWTIEAKKAEKTEVENDKKSFSIYDI